MSRPHSSAVPALFQFRLPPCEQRFASTQREKLAMNRIRNGVLAAITVLAVTVTGALLVNRAQQSGAPESLAVRDVANASTAAPANGVRGPGIPPAPGASQNAPPNPNAGAPTANLK